MAAYQLRTFSDIYTAVAEELKIQLSDTTTINRIKRDINIIYMSEVVPADDFYWARKEAKRIHKKMIQSGSVTVANGSTSVTLSSAPSENHKGKLFAVDGFSEIYTIRAHSGVSTTLTLDTPFQGDSASGKSYKIWEDGIVLPTDCDEVYSAYHEHYSTPMESLGSLQYNDLVLHSPRREGRPRWFTVQEYKDPETYSEISGIPALSTRKSDGNIRTLTFGADVSSYLAEGDRILISNAGNEKYNGEVIVEDVSTTTVRYVHPEKLTESALADLSLEVLLRDDPEDNEMYRQLSVYPYLNNENTTLKIEYIEKVSPLEDDADEPIIPVRDRVILLYGALERAWSRIRNMEEAQRNAAKYTQKLAKMAGNMQSGQDYPKIRPNNIYLTAKRKGRKRYRWSNF